MYTIVAIYIQKYCSPLQRMHKDIKITAVHKCERRDTDLQKTKFHLSLSKDDQCVYLDALKVDRVHHGALKKLDGGVVPLQQTLQLQVGLLPAKRTDQTQNRLINTGLTYRGRTLNLCVDWTI